MLKITCDGRLTRDAKLRVCGEDSLVLNFTIATDVILGKGEQVTEYIECSWFGNHVKNLEQYLKKGLQVFVIGDGSLQSWNKGSKSGVNIRCRVNSLTMGAAPGAGKAQQEQGQASNDLKPLDDNGPFDGKA